MITSEGPNSLIVVAGKSVTLGCETEGDPRPDVSLTFFTCFKIFGHTRETNISNISSQYLIITERNESNPTTKMSSCLNQIIWRKDLHEIDFFATDHKYMLKETGSLFIDKADVTDTARFLCVVENPAGVVTREITLTVHGMSLSENSCGCRSVCVVNRP